MLVLLLDHPHLLLRGQGTGDGAPAALPSDSSTQLWGPHLVLDLPPGQLTHSKLHQHVEEGPQVIMAAHLLGGKGGVTWSSQVLS